MRLVSPVRILGILLLYAVCTFSDNVKEEIVGSSVSEARGYFRREHSLTKPYQGAGMDIPYWNVIGSTLVSDQQIRLTPDLQSRKGAIWNTVPCYSRDWEMKVTFNVHGQTGTLFGDGMAIWYVQEPNILGDVFGSKDYFRGLGVFLDTYSNHNGVHSHSHPYITAMVSNGSLHYDHDSDGTHTQLGGEHTGCEAKFRNKEHDTQVLIRYVGDTLSIFSDVNGDGVWKECLSVGGVHLPTGLYFGVTAATGDLSDNHDVISLKMYEQEYARAEKENEVNRAHIEPSADFVAAPRDHIDSPKPSKLGWVGTTLLVIIGIVVVVLGLGYGVLYLQNRSERSRKRFY